MHCCLPRVSGCRHRLIQSTFSGSHSVEPSLQHPHPAHQYQHFAISQSHSVEASCQRPSVDRQQCCVCFDEFPSKQGPSCDMGHFTCKGCFTQYVASKALALQENFDELLAREGRVYCPCRGIAGGCESQPFTDIVVEQNAEQEAFTAHMAARARAQGQLDYEKRQLQTGCAKNRKDCKSPDLNVLQKQLKSRFPNAKQCARCSFGPIDFAGCNNLRQHHGQRRGGGLIDNSCPRCGWFARDLNSWPRWNGKLPSDDWSYTHWRICFILRKLLLLGMFVLITLAYRSFRQHHIKEVIPQAGQELGSRLACDPNVNAELPPPSAIIDQYSATSQHGNQRPSSRMRIFVRALLIATALWVLSPSEVNRRQRRRVRRTR